MPVTAEFIWQHGIAALMLQGIPLRDAELMLDYKRYREQLDKETKR